MGMTSMFGDERVLSDPLENPRESLIVSNVIHKAIIEISGEQAEDSGVRSNFSSKITNLSKLSTTFRQKI